MAKLLEVRIKRGANGPFRITLVYEGIGTTSVHWVTTNWRDWLKTRGMLTVPRIWEAAYCWDSVRTS